ncbi:BTAD domain-containing putative transcriptional regulator [Nonomuraea sp. NPDC005501]|uniref:AfsR/SARP family transcriptional regulator n=1 Tax=Nonomuraea sp. NPDC005501 TaxID=3156884 RepID=UPI0033BEF8A2
MGSSLRLTLLGGFRLLAGDDQISVSSGSERLLAFLALGCRVVSRSLTAATLWPDAPEHRAYASLRSALARLDGAGRRMLHVGSTEVGLAPDTRVDFHEARALAERILGPDVPAGGEDLDRHAIEVLSHGLLPGWYDDWVLREAEQWHQQRLHALEALSSRFVRAGRFADAVSAASVALHAEPLRESACAALVEAHLAEGNQAEALRQYQLYERVLRGELDLSPTPRLRDLVAGLRPADEGGPGRR